MINIRPDLKGVARPRGRRSLFRVAVVLVLTLLYLLVAEGLIRRDMREWVSGRGFRFLSGSLVGLDELAEDLKRSSVQKVFFVGDSTVHGEAVQRGDQSISFGFQQGIDELCPGRVRAVNLGLTGSSVRIHELLLKHLDTSPPDQVLLFINYRALRRRGAGSVYERRLEGRRTWSTFSELVEYFIDHDLFRRFSLYRNRHRIMGRFLGAPPWFALRQHLFLAPLGGIRRDAGAAKDGEGHRWDQRSWNREALRRLRESFAVPLLDRDYPSVAAIARICQWSQMRGLKLIAVFAPMNMEMIDTLALLDGPTHRKNLRLLTTLLAEYSVESIDATRWMPHELFADSVHMIAKGNLALGEKLARRFLKQNALDCPGNAGGEGGGAPTSLPPFKMDSVLP